MLGAMPNESDQTERLIAIVEQLSDDMVELKDELEQGSLLQKLVTEIQTLHSAIDDLRAEVEWASRNLLQARSPRPPLEPLASMPADPCDPNFAAKVNAVSRRDVPDAEQRKSAGDGVEEMPQDRMRAMWLAEEFRARVVTDATGQHVISITDDEFTRLFGRGATFQKCCAAFKLKWSGERDAATVQCQTCAAVFLDAGEILLDDECLPPLVADQAANQNEAIREPAPTAGPSVPVRNIGTVKRNKVPLYARILSQNHMTDLVRLIGYNEIPMEVFSQRVAPLEAKYGKETIDVAVRELVTLVRRDHLPFVRLSNAARPYVVQLLGRPPAS